MLQVTPHIRIMVAVEPVDFRKGIDGLAGLCRKVLQEDPFSGNMFVFCNKKRTALKALIYDGQGYWLCQKRLSQGTFSWWPKVNDTGKCHLAAHELQSLLWNGNPDQSQVGPMWKKINT